MTTIQIQMDADATPEEIQHAIQSALSAYDRNKSCTGKVKYGCEETAAKSAVTMNDKGTTRNEMEPYQCRHCDGWHIGRKQTQDASTADSIQSEVTEDDNK